MVDDCARHLLLFGFTWPLRVLLAPASSKRTFLLCYCLFFLLSLFLENSRKSRCCRDWRYDGKDWWHCLVICAFLYAISFQTAAFDATLSLFAIAKYEHEVKIKMRINVDIVSNIYKEECIDDLCLSLDCELGFVKASQLFAMTTICSFKNSVRGSQIPPTETFVHPPPSILRWDVKQHDTQLKP